MITAGQVLEGGCLCGAIRYRATGPSLFVGQCACRDCQKASGTGHTTIACVPKEQFAFTGEPTGYVSTGDSGQQVRRMFCPTCGSRLFTIYGELRMVQSGTLDDPSAVTPGNVIYLKDAARWDRFDPALDHFDGPPG